LIATSDCGSDCRFFNPQSEIRNPQFVVTVRALLE
jgi:hypothetical protein